MGALFNKSEESTNASHLLRISLPEPQYQGSPSFEAVLSKRRSIRDFADHSLTTEAVSQLLWAAQGITHPAEGLRTAPSAGALYPLEVYLTVGQVQGIPVGVYQYLPAHHQIVQLIESDIRNALSRAAVGQSCIKHAALVIVLSAVYHRTIHKYGERGIRYVHMEVGHVAQNIHLQAVSLHLGTVVVGAFYDEEVKQLLHMKPEEQPLCIMPVGVPLV